MRHPFVELKPEYTRNLARMVVTRPTVVNSAAKNVIGFIDSYIAATAGTGMPPVIGGLPVGSTPERPEGTEYDEVPPEEPYR